MSVTRDDAGNIADFHRHASGLLPKTRTSLGTPSNYRDASGPSATGGGWRNKPTPIVTPGRGGQNPYGGGRLKSNDGKASSSQHASKRQKLDHHTPSKYFPQPPSEPRTRNQHAQAVLHSSPSRRSRIADAIIIDEDDASDIDGSSSKPVTLKTSSPDPIDVITPDHMETTTPDPAYTFDRSKPSPMHQYSLSLEEARSKSPTDGESTARLRDLKQTEEWDPPSRSNGDSKSAKAPVTLKVAPSAQADAPGRGNTGRLISVFEGGRNVIDLRNRIQHRKNGMKPKQAQRQVLPLTLTLRDPHATRSSGFVSGSGYSKGKATQRGVCSLPLQNWSIGVDIPLPETTPEPRANLIWERGLIKVQHANSSTLFELRLEKGSLESVQYVDVKKTPNFNPLIQIHPFETATVHGSTTDGFKLGSPHDDGLLTFVFDKDATDWDEKFYSDLVQVLVGTLVSKDGKSTLDRPAVNAVWEAVTRAHTNRLKQGELESLTLDNRPKKAPDLVEKPRPRPKSRTEGAPIADIFVRRSARLSGVEQQPDPDEVILTYRSGTGSLNITNGDVSRLKPREYLNDTLIEFGLKLWLADLQEGNPELASQVHVFSSFFYKKLSTKDPGEGYNSVRKWTAKFDLFQKKYIIVPINENMHWYLAIIYFPERILLPRPAQVKKVAPRRSTRHSGVIDYPSVKDSEHTPEQPLPPGPDPPPSVQADSASHSGLITPDSPRTDDQREEIVVERMVESGDPLSDLVAKKTDGQCVEAEAADKGVPVDYAADREDALVLVYPSPHAQLAELPPLSPLDPQDDVVVEQDGSPASGSVSEGSGVRTSGIPPTNFYGKSNHRRRNVTSPEIAIVDNDPPVEIVVEEDIIMGNPDSEHEGVAEHPITYIFTFDSLSSRHPQAVNRLSKYLLMEAHDKKQLVEDTLTEPKGIQASVPNQNNLCDCGLYLLHFTKTFMKDPKLSSEIIINKPSPQKGRRVIHEHWDDSPVKNYRNELTTRINSLSEEWKRQRSEQDAATKNETETVAAAPEEQQQSSTNPTPAASLKADNDSDSEIEVLGTPTKAPPSKAASRRNSRLPAARKKAAATRARGS